MTIHIMASVDGVVGQRPHSDIGVMGRNENLLPLPRLVIYKWYYYIVDVLMAQAFLRLIQ